MQCQQCANLTIRILTYVALSTLFGSRMQTLRTIKDTRQYKHERGPRGFRLAEPPHGCGVGTSFWHTHMPIATSVALRGHIWGGVCSGTSYVAGRGAAHSGGLCAARQCYSAARQGVCRDCDNTTHEADDDTQPLQCADPTWRAARQAHAMHAGLCGASVM